VPARALATLPGAPVVLPALTTSLVTLPPELVELRRAVDEVVASLPAAPRIVVVAAADASVWGAGDLGLGGLGTTDPSLPWTGSGASALAERLRLPVRSDRLPTEARVVSRLVGPQQVTAVVALPPDDRLAASLLAAEDQHDAGTAALAAVGDLSASIGPHSPRPGEEPDLGGLIVGGRVDPAELSRLLDAGGLGLAGALVLAVRPDAPPLAGSVHVVRGVATLVATSTPTAM